MKYFPLIVNKERLLSPDYIPDSLTEPAIPFNAPSGDERRLLEKSAAKAAMRLFTQAALEQIGLVGVSGYRSYERQKELYEDAMKRKSSAVAPPGASEHQTGLALDIVDASYQILDQGQEDTLVIQKRENGLPGMRRCMDILYDIRKTRKILPDFHMNHGISAMWEKPFLFICPLLD